MHDEGRSAEPHCALVDHDHRTHPVHHDGRNRFENKNEKKQQFLKRKWKRGRKRSRKVPRDTRFEKSDLDKNSGLTSCRLH